MNLFELLAAFGGGVLGASIGALPAFIMTGVVCLIGQIGACADSMGGTAVGMAFGSMFGPHIAFAGGVAAAAYARKAGKLENGADIATACFGLGEPMVLLVGGIFGVIGYLIKFVFSLVFGGTVSTRLVTDLPGITVFVSGIIARLAFGKRGLGSGGEHKALSSGKAMGNLMLVAIGYSLCVGGIYVAADGAIAGYNVICFGIAAVGLIFAQFGVAYCGCHHIMIISATAATGAWAAGWGGFPTIIAAVVAGVVAALLCDFETNVMNTDVDSHIDGPAFAITIMTFVCYAIWGPALLG